MQFRLDWRSRLQVIKSVLSSKAYLALFFVLLTVYFAFNLWINQFYETLPVFLTFRLSFVLPYAFLTILIGVVVALNFTLVAYKLKQIIGIKKETGMTMFGAFGGMLGGACPGCFVGLFPSLAGAFGVTATLSALPFKGYEIQVVTLLIVLIVLYVVANPLTCKVRIKRNK